MGPYFVIISTPTRKNTPQRYPPPPPPIYFAFREFRNPTSMRFLINGISEKTHSLWLWLHWSHCYSHLCDQFSHQLHIYRTFWILHCNSRYEISFDELENLIFHCSGYCISWIYDFQYPNWPHYASASRHIHQFRIEVSHSSRDQKRTHFFIFCK